MAFTKKSTKANNTTETATNAAVFSMHGIIADVFEGKKYNYISVNVDSENINPKTNKPYYNTFRVACDKSIALPIDEQPAEITGTISSFYDRDKQRTEYTFYAKTVECVD